MAPIMVRPGSDEKSMTPVETFTENGFVKTMSSQDREDRPKSVMNMSKIAQNYLQTTSIHGLQFWGDHHPSTWWENTYWMFFVVGSWITGIALIGMTIQWWYSSPIMITINADPVSISEVPFPSFTICNMNKVLKSKVKYIEQELKKENVSHLHHKYYLEEMMLVNEICLKHGKSHEEKEAGDLEFNSQELVEMLSEVRCHSKKQVLSL